MNEPITENIAGGGDQVEKKKRRRRSKKKKQLQQQQEAQESVEDLSEGGVSLVPPYTWEPAPEAPSQKLGHAGTNIGESITPSTAEHQPQQLPDVSSSPSLPVMPQGAPRYQTRSQNRNGHQNQLPSMLLAGLPNYQNSFAQAGQSRQYGTVAPNRPTAGLSTHPQGVYEEFQKLSLSPPNAQSPLQSPAGQVRQQHWKTRGRKKKTPLHQRQFAQVERATTFSPNEIPYKPGSKPRFADRTLDDVQFAVSLPNRSLKGRGEDTEIKLDAPPPSLEYLQLASEPSALVENPAKRRLLIILDLNGTLFYRNRLRNGLKDKYTPVARPGLSSFFEYIFREHYVVFFSSAMQATVLHLLQSILKPEYRSKVTRIFTREDMGIPEEYYHHKVSTFKRLTMVWRSLKLHHHTWDFSQRDTVLLDDSPDKAATEPHNHIEVPEYTQDLHVQGGDWVLRRAAGYIEEARKWENVSSYMRANPFDAAKDYDPPAGWEDYMSDLPPPVRKIARVPPEGTAKFHERYQQDVARGVAKPYSIRGLIEEGKNL
ncbi:hypothetical protein TWF696_005982 [Orbilia brochopaga]|uniref:Mitochondrial import inner membrane translocase subunit TIM50 n=1 Tax=Orbilia brochopaga TaxID=3140254 RepID=A0AAV9UVF2_9PEZI